MKKLSSVVIIFLIVSACASHTGVVSMGQDTFMIAKQQATGFPGLGNMKAEIVAEGSQYCAALGKAIQILSTHDTQPPYVLGNYPRSEIQFMCLATGDSELQLPKLQKAPDISISENPILNNEARTAPFIGNAGAGGSVPAGHRIIGKWYNGLGNGQYIRYQFTEVGVFSYSSPLKMVSGTFTVQDDRFTLRPSDGVPESFTFWFECIGSGSFSEYMTLKSTATLLETPFHRDPTDPGQRCK